MPAFSSDFPSSTATATATHPHSFASPQERSHDKNSVGNTFVWTNWPNGDSNHLDTSPNDRSLPNGSTYSLNGPRSSASSYNRDFLQSKDESMHSSGNGSAREPREGRPSSMTMERENPRKSSDTGLGAASRSTSITSQQANGTSLSHRSLNAKHMINGDYSRPSVDELVCSDPTTNTSVARLSTSLPDSNGRLSPDPGGLSPTQISPYRHSSPVQAGVNRSNTQDSASSSFRQRHTLQVPRTTSGRRSSRDQTNDIAYSSGRISPTTEIRRPSLGLARRTTRTNQSDILVDEANPEEDAVRWAEAIKQRRASKRRREEDDDRVVVGTKVDQNHVNWVTSYNMLTGIRFTVSRINAKMDRELTPADFEAQHKFSFDITGNELTPSAQYDFKFKDYAPWVFRHLRSKFRLDPADYLMSLTSKYILSELGSPGKSGSFFYFSRDYKYIIKTIHHAEHKLLRKILPEYYKHVEQNPNTLISQFYGLHRVKMAYGRKIHFVVMNNLFPPHRDIHSTFDLKGSMIGREMSEEYIERNPRSTMKDLNWLRRHQQLECGPGKRDFFLAQLKRDVELLKRLKIMDYSLLVGIHDLGKGNEENLRDKTLQVFQPGGSREEETNPNMLMRTPSKLENERKARELRMLIQKERPVPLDKATAKMPDEILDERKFHVFYSDDGGFRATHENGQPGQEIYYLGIIDCLTHYGTIKRLEHFFKGLSSDRTQISPIPPEGYGDRFLNFIRRITLSREEADRCQESQAAEQTNPVERSGPSTDNETSRHASAALATGQQPPETAGSGPNTLPIVDEAGEGSSVGGHSQRSPRCPSPRLEKELPSLPPQAPPQVPEKTNGTFRNRQNLPLSVS
ncbi:hypothetical protein BJX99DRAFT_212589 [Aspergillus californicus]